MDFFDRCSGHYAYDALLSFPNGSNLQKCYLDVKRILKSYYMEPINLPYGFPCELHKLSSENLKYKECTEYARFSVSFEEAKTASLAVLADCPLIYFADTYYIYGNKEKGLSLVGIGDEFSEGFVRIGCRSIIEKELQETAAMAEIDGISNNAKISAVHSYIVANCSYDKHLGGEVNYTDLTAHSVLGYAKDHKAVCEGIAKTFQAVMTYLGIECIYVSGVVYNNPKDPTAHSGRHGWNMVRSDDGWKVIDVTAKVSNHDYPYMFEPNPKAFREMPPSMQNTQKDCFRIPLPTVS